MTNGTLELHWLLSHEVRAASRYRRFVSLVMMAAGGKMEKGWKFLEDNIRESDLLFDMGSYSAVVMTETDKQGALKAVDRFAKLLDDTKNFRFALGAFPGDGRRAPEFVSTVYRRLRRSETESATSANYSNGQTA